MNGPVDRQGSTSTARSTPRIVHICGFPSSGTDLLCNFVSSHPDLHVGGEFPMLPKLADRFGPTVAEDLVPDVVRMLRSGDVYSKFVGSDPRLDELERVGDKVSVASIYAAMLTHRCVRWCGNKTPQNTENVAPLLHLFPDGRFIFICRDIRDVCLSWHKKWGKDMRLCASKWNARMQKGLTTLARLPTDRVLYLRYEDFISDPGKAGEAISDFLGVPYSDNFTEYHRHISRTGDGKKNFGEAIRTNNHGQWRFALRHGLVRRIEEIAMPTMKQLGYGPELAVRHRPITAREILSGTVTDAYAALAVGNRYSHQNRLGARLRRVAISVRYKLAAH